MTHRNDQSTLAVRGVDKPLGKKRRVKKYGAPPANTEIIAPGAELPAPRQKKPHEVEADKPESYFDHDEAVPMLDFDGSEGRGTVRGRIQKKVDLQREAEIVERLQDAAVLAEQKDAARLLPLALDLADKLTTRYALNEARGYIDLLSKKAFAAEDAKVEKRRVYLKPGEHAPPGQSEQEGERGGRYYETGGYEGRHEPKPRLEHVGAADAALFDLADGCVDIAREEGWFVQVDTIRAYDPQEWSDRYKGRESAPGGKTSKAAPYAFYNKGEIAIGPKMQKDLQAAAMGSKVYNAKYAVQAMAHEIVHARNPISGCALRRARIAVFLTIFSCSWGRRLM